MKVEGLLFAGGAFFYGIVAAAYWFITGELVGSTALALTAGLAFLIGFYVLYTGRRVGTRPEDDPHANIEDADAEYGFFSPHSWWPLPIAAAAALTGAGLVYARWMIALGALIWSMKLACWRCTE